MRTIEDLIKKEKGRKALILCTGASVKLYKKQVEDFIRREKPFTIGINNITNLFVPDYHLWTNTKRFRDFGKNIKKESTLLLGKGISIKLIYEVIGKRDYTLINFTDMKEGVPIGYNSGKILGFYRTAGNLAIMIAHLMGCSEVNIVGMDGHTFYNYEDIKNGKQSHHCYNEQYTPFEKGICIKKDKITNMVLTNLKNFGIKLRILTPTVYSNFYEEF